MLHSRRNIKTIKPSQIKIGSLLAKADDRPIYVQTHLVNNGGFTLLRESQQIFLILEKSSESVKMFCFSQQKIVVVTMKTVLQYFKVEGKNETDNGS